MDTEFLNAVDKTADTTFNATDFIRLRLAERPSGSVVKGFYRPGERRMGGPIKVTIEPNPAYRGAPSGRAPTVEEGRVAWPLHEEYLAGRLGKNAEENCRLWLTVEWLDRLYQIAVMPAEAVATMPLSTGWKAVADHSEIKDGFGVERAKVDNRDTNGIAIDIDECDLLNLVEGKQDQRNDVAGLRTVGLPSPGQRAAAAKTVRILMIGMRHLWHPVKRAIVDQVTMKSLGKAQGVGDSVAAAVGRQRVLEGLRLAALIRTGLARRERALEPRSKPRPAPAWASMRVPSLDWIIREVLAALPDRPLHANDNGAASPAKVAA